MGRLNHVIHKKVDDNFPEQVKITAEMVKLRSVLDDSEATQADPFGARMSVALDKFLTVAKGMGFYTKNLDNKVGYVEIGNADAPLTGILAHLDVVPEGNSTQWDYPPYDGIIVNNYLYGRGAVDDKGPAIAALYAMAALRDTVALNRRFRLIVGLDEENGSRCIKHYTAHEEIPEFSFSPDASFPVVYAEKGILRIEIKLSQKLINNSADKNVLILKSIKGGTRFNVVPDKATAAVAQNDITNDIIVTGKTAHAMEPYKGDNAVQKLLNQLLAMPLDEQSTILLKKAFSLTGEDWTGKSLGIECSDDVSGALTCNCASIESYKNDKYFAIGIKFDIRYPVTSDAEKILSNIKEHADILGGSVEIITHKPPLYVPKESYIVQTLLDAYHEIMDDRLEPISIGGGTYCRFLPNSVSFGPVFPGEEEYAHQPNERISLDDLKKCTHIYAEALLRLNEKHKL